jgi:regulator of sirC expression with transglutaminase-like and TPR domain
MSGSPAPLLADFQRFQRHPEDVIEGALLVSRLVDPTTDTQWCRAELLKLANAVGAAGNAHRVLEVFRAEGFRGADTYYEARNSALQSVLATRQGIPISLAVCLIGVARLLDIPAQGVNFPGHFLLTVERQLIDPFELSVLDAEARAARLAAAGVPPGLALRPASASDIVQRMLNNLRGLSDTRGDATSALEITDYQCVLAPRDFGLRMVRADLWQALGVEGMARHEWELARELAPNAEARAGVETRLRTQPAAPRNLH